uniref:thiol-disulfide oxidoreductase DCC family protein n=1 Tax=Castellaniella defragrans TaxID=75697 RepID=UPI00333EC032
MHNIRESGQQEERKEQTGTVSGPDGLMVFDGLCNFCSAPFFDRGRPPEASVAVIAILRRLPRPWRWLTMLRVVPRPLRDAAYRMVARNRYRLLERREACMVPPSHLRARFIDDISPDEP